MDLHDDSIELCQHEDAAAASETSGKVVFTPFEGVGPRRFFDLFSVGLSSGYETIRKPRGEKGKFVWERSKANLRVPMFPTTYLEREMLAAREIVVETKGEA